MLHAPSFLVSEVISFRPTEEELELIEFTRKVYGLDSRADALRRLIMESARKPNLEPLFRFKLRRTPNRRSITSEEIDEALAQQAYPAPTRSGRAKRKAAKRKSVPR